MGQIQLVCSRSLAITAQPKHTLSPQHHRTHKHHTSTYLAVNAQYMTQTKHPTAACYLGTLYTNKYQDTMYVWCYNATCIEVFVRPHQRVIIVALRRMFAAENLQECVTSNHQHVSAGASTHRTKTTKGNKTWRSSLYNVRHESQSLFCLTRLRHTRQPNMPWPAYNSMHYQIMEHHTSSCSVAML